MCVGSGMGCTPVRGAHLPCGGESPCNYSRPSTQPQPPVTPNHVGVACTGHGLWAKRKPASGPGGLLSWFERHPNTPRWQVRSRQGVYWRHVSL